MVCDVIRRVARDQLGLEIRRVVPVAEAAKSVSCSLFDEETIVRRLLSNVGGREWCVDIGAGDGRTQSNSYRFFSEGWQGLALDADPNKFVELARGHSDHATVRLVRARVTPDNTVALLQAAEVPRDFGFLTIDIDGYDHFVLDTLLSAYRPALVCTEINEKIPPPLRFTVLCSEAYEWRGDHFYGQSIAQLETLLDRHGYALVELEYNNAFLMPSELAPRSVTALQAYREGYPDRPDRREKLPWNADVEFLQAMSPEDAAVALRTRFAAYEGQYELSVD
jgi:hypothetical protein